MMAEGAADTKDMEAQCPRLGPGLKTFVINLERRADRRAHVEELCKQLDLDYEILKAVDGRALSERVDSSIEVVCAQNGTAKADAKFCAGP